MRVVGVADAAHDQSAGRVLDLAAAGECDEGDLGDLGVGDPALLVLDALIATQAASSMLVIAVVTVLVILAVTPNHVFLRIAVPTNALP